MITIRAYITRQYVAEFRAEFPGIPVWVSAGPGDDLTIEASAPDMQVFTDRLAMSGLRFKVAA